MLNYTTNMLFLWLFSCFLVVLCSATCSDENLIFTGDHVSHWVAEIRGDSTPHALSPNTNPIHVSKSEEELEVIVRPTCGPVKLLVVSLITKNIQEIDVQDQTKTLTSGNNELLETSFDFSEPLVNQITIRVKTQNREASLQTIFVKACLPEGPKTLNDELQEVFKNMSLDWKAQDIEKVKETYYTDNIIYVVQGLGILQGKDNIEPMLRELIRDRAYAIRTVIDSGVLSETRSYSVLEVTFYTDDTFSVVYPPVYSLLLLWQWEDNVWKIDKIAQTNDGLLCG